MPRTPINNGKEGGMGEDVKPERGGTEGRRWEVRDQRHGYKNGSLIFTGTGGLLPCLRGIDRRCLCGPYTVIKFIKFFTMITFNRLALPSSKLDNEPFYDSKFCTKDFYEQLASMLIFTKYSFEGKLRQSCIL